MAVELSIEQGLAHLHLNRPKALNALSFEILKSLNDTLSKVEQAIEQQQVRGLVITGAGEKSFCAGADIPELLGRTLLQQHEGARLGQEVFNRIAALRIPSVAVLNWHFHAPFAWPPRAPRWVCPKSSWV